MRGASVRYSAGPPVVVCSLRSVQPSVAKLVFRKGIVSLQPASAVAAENVGPTQLSVPILNPPPNQELTCVLIYDLFCCEGGHSICLQGAGYSE